LKKVTRLDRGSLKSMHKTGEGYAFVEGYATRAGVFVYRDQAGNVSNELRPPEEVGRADSIGSLARKPFTNDHPKGGVLVTADNADEYSVGCVDPEVIWESDLADGYIKVRGTIQQGKAVADVLGGKRELSCGYTCDVDETPGVWIDHEGKPHKYDAIQRNIEYNHLAIVAKGRAGDLAALRVDAEQVEEPETNNENTPHTQVRTMKKIKIDGMEFDVETEQAAIQRAIAAVEAKRNDALEAVKEVSAKADAKVAELQAKADADQAKFEITTLELEKVKAEKAQAPKFDAAAQVAWFNERQALVAHAEKLDAKFDAADDNAAIKSAIVLTRFDEADLPTQAHVDVAFSLMSKESKSDDSETFGRQILGAQTHTKADAGETMILDAEAAYAARFK
jgi:hypothetical protein